MSDYLGLLNSIGDAGTEGKEEWMDVMTDKQFDKILKMFSMILDGCKDLTEAKEKVAELLEDRKKEKPDK